MYKKIETSWKDIRFSSRDFIYKSENIIATITVYKKSKIKNSECGISSSYEEILFKIYIVNILIILYYI